MKLRIKIFCLWMLLFSACDKTGPNRPEIEKQAISTVLNNWHLAAAHADFQSYFSYLADSSVFIGTDATENWNKKEFMDFSKPYFERGKAWSFTAIERNIYLNQSADLAWFDELLNTQMKICRGSGIMEKMGADWKIKHYVLSMTIPNEYADSVVLIKTAAEDSILLKMNQEPN